MLIIGGSGSGKTNSLFNLISQQPDINKIYLYVKDPYETKYQFLVNKWESTGLRDINDSIAFIAYSDDMDDIYKNIEGYNPNVKRKVLIVFDNLINPVVIELFIRIRKLSVSLIFITKSCFAMPKNIRLNSTHNFIIKIPNKRELQQTAFNHSSDTDCKDFINFYKNVLRSHFFFSYWCYSCTG